MYFGDFTKPKPNPNLERFQLCFTNPYVDSNSENFELERSLGSVRSLHLLKTTSVAVLILPLTATLNKLSSAQELKWSRGSNENQ